HQWAYRAQSTHEALHGPSYESTSHSQTRVKGRESFPGSIGGRELAARYLGDAISRVSWLRVRQDVRVSALLQGLSIIGQKDGTLLHSPLINDLDVKTPITAYLESG